MTALPRFDGASTDFTMLYLDESGRFLDPYCDQAEEPRIILPGELPRFLARTIRRPQDVTDFFVWVHGWQNDEVRAIKSARQLFAGLDHWFKMQRTRYPRLGQIVPGFVAVHWPSSSTPGPAGYRKIRNRASAMTTAGEAEFFLASLLGFLDEGNERSSDRKVLRSKDGFYIHCLGHSFGGRFLTAAIQAAAQPTERTRKTLASVHRNTGFAFNVDSLCVLQMAAGAEAFGDEFSSLLAAGPICGPIVLTHSTADTALCGWHKLAEFEPGIGCRGATAPVGRIASIPLHPVDRPYRPSDFAKDITNIDASQVFRQGGWAEGGHSDFWHQETLHLIASVVEEVRG